MKEDIHIYMNQLKAIFLDNNNWEKFKKKYKKKYKKQICPNVIKEVEEFQYCDDLSNGF